MATSAQETGLRLFNLRLPDAAAARAALESFQGPPWLRDAVAAWRQQHPEALDGALPTGPHSADRDGDWRIAMSELLRVIQFYNAHGHHCDAATEDGYAPGPDGGLAQASESSSETCLSPSLDAQEPWEFVNPLEVKRSPLVEAYMQKYGIKLPEIPEEHIKLWRAWVTRQHGLSPQRHRGHGEEGAEDASRFSEDEVRSSGFSLAEVGTGTSPPRSAGSLVPVPGKACTCHSSDYAPRDWAISFTELLRVIQFYNAGAYHRCDYGEDGFCPGAE